MTDRGLLPRLIESLRALPGIGPKSAQRMAFHLLQRDRGAGRRLAEVLAAAMEQIGHCERCRTLTDQPVCALCANPQRDPALLCIVEQPVDVVALEQATDWRGLYFVLGGRLSPLDGVGPAELGLEQLRARLHDGIVTEAVLALSPTIEGNATGQYISDLAVGSGARITRIAHGVPVGGELEFVDGGTLALAFAGRRQV